MLVDNNQLVDLENQGVCIEKFLYWASLHKMTSHSHVLQLKLVKSAMTDIYIEKKLMLSHELHDMVHEACWSPNDRILSAFQILSPIR